MGWLGKIGKELTARFDCQRLLRGSIRNISQLPRIDDYLLFRETPARILPANTMIKSWGFSN